MMNHKTYLSQCCLSLPSSGAGGLRQIHARGDVATNYYYYVVRSVCVGAHADDAERAEFDFSLTPGD